MMELKCTSGLFTVQLQEDSRLRREMPNESGDFQFCLRGLQQNCVYTIFIEEAPFQNSTIAEARQTRLISSVPGTASFIPDNAAKVLSSLPYCFSPTKQKFECVNEFNEKSISIFEIDTATSSVRQMHAQADTVPVEEKQSFATTCMIQSSFLVKSGANLIRNVSSSEHAARLVKNSSKIIEQVSKSFSGKRNESDLTEELSDETVGIPQAIPVSAPMVVISSKEQEMLETNSCANTDEMVLSNDDFVIENSTFLKRVKDVNSLKKKFCAICGVKTHRRNGITRKRVPLNVDGVVSDGQCLVCTNSINNDSCTSSVKNDKTICRRRSVTLDDETILQSTKKSLQFSINSGRARFNSDGEVMLDKECHKNLPPSEKHVARIASLTNESSKNDRISWRNNRRVVRRKVMKRIRKVVSLLSPDSSITSSQSFENRNIEEPLSLDNDVVSSELLRSFSSGAIDETAQDSSNMPELNFQNKRNWDMRKFRFSENLNLLIPQRNATEDTSYFVNIENIPFLASLKSLNTYLNKSGTGEVTSGNSTFQVNNVARVLFVGKDGCGRSSLIQSLKKYSSKRSSSEVRRNFVDELGVQVHEWETRVDGNLQSLQLKFWDMRDIETQDLFFSNRAFYVLVWSMGQHISPLPVEDVERSTIDKELRLDIEHNVLSFLDRIVRRVPGAVVVPVLTFADSFDVSERNYRVGLFKKQILDHIRNSSMHISPPTLVFSRKTDDVLTVSNSTKSGINNLKKILINIASVNRNCHHVGRSIPSKWFEVRIAIENLRKRKKICSVLELRKEIRCSNVNEEDIYGALRFLVDLGEICYFSFDHFTIEDNQTIFLRPSWLIEVVKNILRVDVRDKIRELECSDFDSSNDMVKRTNMPIISSTHAHQLIVNGCETSLSTDISILIQRILIDYDLMQSIEFTSGCDITEDNRRLPKNTYFYLPSLLQREKSIGFSYKCKESWKKTLCNTWWFQNDIKLPHRIIGDILFSIIYSINSKSNNVILGHEFNEQKYDELIIRQTLAWRESFIIWIEYIDVHGTKNTVEISARIVDSNSVHCVGGKFLSKDKKKLIVSAKGHINENDGSTVWKGGFKLVLGAVRQILEQNELPQCEEIVCPVCLSSLPIQEVASWSSSHINKMIDDRCPFVTCDEGHHVDAMLVSGRLDLQELSEKYSSQNNYSSLNGTFNITSLYKSVVLIALWDGEQIHQAGSGFIVDSAKGLIVSSSHTVINMENFSNRFGDRYFSQSLHDPKILVGVLQDSFNHSDSSFQATYRYSANIVCENVHNVDACVLRIKSMFERDLLGDAVECNNVPMIPLNSGAIRMQQLKHLPLTSKCEIEEQIAVIGYRQERRIGVATSFEKCNRYIDFSKGYVREVWQNPYTVCDSRCSPEFQPHSEILVSCLSVGGYSGGPMINMKGEVIGIVRASDREGRQCYIVPTSEFLGLVEKAKTMFI